MDSCKNCKYRKQIWNANCISDYACVNKDSSCYGATIFSDDIPCEDFVEVKEE